MHAQRLELLGKIDENMRTVDRVPLYRGVVRTTDTFQFGRELAKQKAKEQFRSCVTSRSFDLSALPSTQGQSSHCLKASENSHSESISGRGATLTKCSHSMQTQTVSPGLDSEVQNVTRLQLLQYASSIINVASWCLGSLLEARILKLCRSVTFIVIGLSATSVLFL